jgi:glucan phosphoethanolaminetransferase (alkaline phosphatase superfamily)
MNKTEQKQQIKKLTWKYFWQQKVVESIVGIFGIATLIYLPYYFMFFLNYLFNTTEFTTNFDGSNMDVVSIWVIGLLCLVILCLVCYLLFILAKEWVKSNWNKAKKRAESEVKE